MVPLWCDLGCRFRTVVVIKAAAKPAVTSFIHPASPTGAFSRVRVYKSEARSFEYKLELSEISVRILEARHYAQIFILEPARAGRADLPRCRAGRAGRGTPSAGGAPCRRSPRLHTDATRIRRPAARHGKAAGRVGSDPVPILCRPIGAEGTCRYG